EEALARYRYKLADVYKRRPTLEDAFNEDMLAKWIESLDEFDQRSGVVFDPTREYSESELAKFNGWDQQQYEQWVRSNKYAHQLALRESGLSEDELAWLQSTQSTQDEPLAKEVL